MDTLPQRRESHEVHCSTEMNLDQNDFVQIRILSKTRRKIK